MNEDRSSAAAWEERYKENHTPWDHGGPSPTLRQWIENGTVPGPRVLVPGCGFGHDVVELAARGFDVTAVDFAPSAIAHLTQTLAARGLTAELVCEDFFAWHATMRFDAVFEQTSLCALPPSRWVDYSVRLARWLEPGGRLLALFMQTGRPGGPPWHLDPLAMQRLFKPPAWRWIEQRPVFAGPVGRSELAAVIEYRGLHVRAPRP
jgi:SAM-dependent methyltransferase